MRIRVAKNSEGEEISERSELSSNGSMNKKLEEDIKYEVEDYAKWILSAAVVIMVAYWWQFFLTNVMEYVWST